MKNYKRSGLVRIHHVTLDMLLERNNGTLAPPLAILMLFHGFAPPDTAEAERKDQGSCALKPFKHEPNRPLLLRSSLFHMFVTKRKLTNVDSETRTSGLDLN